MDMVFKRDYRLRTSDFDCRRHITPTAVLDLFQEVAGHHAEELGIGFEPLLEKKMLWVIVRVKYEVLSQPSTHSTVVVKTWPLPPTRAGFQRDYLIEDENGNTLIKGTSDWVVMHSEKRRLMPAGEIYPEGHDFCPDHCFQEKTAKLHDFEAEGEGYTVYPAFSDLDMNGHINNIRYAGFVLNAVNPAEGDVIESFQVDYHKEVRGGAPLTVYTKRDGKEILAKGCADDSDRMFLCKITLK